jgi:hypothetical protein
MNVGIGTETALFPEKGEYIMEISFAVRGVLHGVQNQIQKKAWNSRSSE